MKPEINQTLQTLAQELIQRFSPLIKDEYEQSRLNSWGTLLLLASMDLDEATENLIQENKMTKDFLKKYLKNIKDKKLIEDIDFLIQERSTSYRMSSLDELNQRYRGLLVRAQAHFEIQQNQAALKDSWKILRAMHGHRKVSHLLTLLRE
tara:strand:+ start:1415 stop:1864 length:450 start_codon:yes stop_codon:yes gene_type:complete